jgi:hypothetical protein
MKTFTTAEIRDLITLADEGKSNPHELASKMSDALEYLLRFVEWRPATDKPTSPSLMVYPPDGKTVQEPRYGIGFYGSFGLWEWNWSMPPKFYVPLPPSPQEKKEAEQ